MKNHKQPRHHKQPRYNFDSINAKQVEEISLNALYFPRTMTLLFVTVILTFYFVMKRDNEDFGRNIESGLYCMIAMYLVISALAFPNGPFTRPHPVFWRLIFGASVFYLLSLAFACCLHMDQIKSVLYWVDPDVRFAKREIDIVEAYAVNCSTVTVERVYSMFDIFAVGHVVGWIVKALSLRSYIMCWTISILWEFTEMFFMDIFPNFQECWWDQIVFDVCLCNALGIFVGMKICKYLELRKYRWESIKLNVVRFTVCVWKKRTCCSTCSGFTICGCVLFLGADCSVETTRQLLTTADVSYKELTTAHHSNIHSTTGKLRRVAMQFTPRQWMGVTWIGPGSSTRRIMAVFGVLMGFLVCELNTFFLKHLLRFPATHPFCWGRLILLAFAAAPACRQGYVYMTDVTCNRMGTQAWVFCATMCLESIISIKIGYAEFTKAQVKKLVAWIFVTMLMTLASLFALVYLCKAKRQKNSQVHTKYYYESTDDSCWEKSPDKSD